MVFGGETSNHLFNHNYEFYPLSEGTSSVNTRISLNINDSLSTGFTEMNLFGAGGVGSENRINFYNPENRAGGPASIIKSVNLGSSLARFGIFTAPTN
jgi:hypothetical protein